MARTPKILCDSCGVTRIDAGAPFCGGCGRPTVWATHTDRTRWEVQQWRRARSGSGDEPPGSVMTLPARAPQRPAAAPDDWDGFLSPADPKPRAARDPRPPSAIITLLKRALAALRKGFGSSMMMPLETKPDAQTADPVAVEPVAVEPVAVEPELVPSAAEPPRMMLVREEAPKPKAPAKPRKRPNPPTNKDMLKKTLSVLTKVEQRLEQLEQEVAGIDDAVRKVVPPSDATEEQTAVGE